MHARNSLQKLNWHLNETKIKLGKSDTCTTICQCWTWINVWQLNFSWALRPIRIAFSPCIETNAHTRKSARALFLSREGKFDTCVGRTHPWKEKARGILSMYDWRETGTLRHVWVWVCHFALKRFAQNPAWFSRSVGGVGTCSCRELFSIDIVCSVPLQSRMFLSQYTHIEICVVDGSWVRA